MTAEVVGYAGSVLVAISMLMNNIWRLRWINMFGAGTFAAYGLLTTTYPVFALNMFIVVVDLFYIHRLATRRDAFTSIPLLWDSPFVHQFLSFYREDIGRYQPEFSSDALQDPRGFFVLRNMIPVGLMIYECTDPGSAKIHLDYTIPDYRDFKNARFAYHAHGESFAKANVRELFTVATVKDHQRYLTRIGYTASAEDPTRFRLSL